MREQFKLEHLECVADNITELHSVTHGKPLKVFELLRSHDQCSALGQQWIVYKSWKQITGY